MKRFIYIMLFASLFVIACNKESAIKDDVPTEPEMMTFTATIADPDADSKATLTHEGTVGKVEWEMGDQIFVHGKKIGKDGDTRYSGVATVVSLSSDKKTATFSMPVIQDTYGDRGSDYAANFFAAYPASAVPYGNDYSGSKTWYYFSSWNKPNNMLMAACNNTATQEGVYSFQFVHITGAISFVVSGDFDSYVFSGNNDEIVAYNMYQARVDRYSYQTSLNIKYAQSQGDADPTSGASTSLTVDSWTGADGLTNNFIYIPGGANLTKGFTIKFFKNGNEVKRVSTSSAKNVAPGKYLDLGDITSRLKNPPSHVPASWTSGATNLSDDGGVAKSANCYYVYHKNVDGYSANAGKAFKIRATKGNSTESVGAISSVSVLWETYCDVNSVTAKSIIDEVDYDDSYIYFKMPDSDHMMAGNALIAAKDALGTVLWSWHIWVPTSVISPVSNTEFCTSAVMDRNLGALEVVSAVESAVPTSAYGLYYQWGRKDPFFPNTWTRYATIDISSSSNRVSTAVSIQNPTIFNYWSDPTTSPKSYNWNEEEISTLWNDEGSKTIYDPCPIGYKVGIYNSSVKMWSSGNDEGWTYSATYGWFKYGTITFPLAGYMSSTSLSRAVTRSNIWSATYQDVERARSAYFDTAKLTASTPSPAYNYNSYYKPTGCSVRCVVE